MFLYILLSPALYVGLLGHSEYSVREAASKMLSGMGYRALPLLRNAAATSPSAEVRSRARTIISSASTRRLQSTLQTMEPWPCIDSGWYDTENLCYHFDSVVDKTLPQYHDLIFRPGMIRRNFQHYRAATRDWAIDQLQAGRPAQEISDVLKEMWRREVVWEAQPKSTGPWGIFGPVPVPRQMPPRRDN